MQDETIETLQVISPPETPNGAGTTEHSLTNGTGDPPPEKEKPDPGTPGEDAASGEDADPELDALAAEADAFLKPQVEPPEPEKTQDATGQRQFTAEEKLDYLVNTVYGLDQRLKAQEQRSEGEPGSEAGRVDDIYNGSTFGSDPDPAADPNNPLAEEVQALRQTVSELEGVVRGLHTTQTSMQQNFKAQEQAEKENAEIVSLQEEYNLSEVDAQRAYALFKKGEYGKGMRYAQGRSQVESATDAMREQRASDRDLAGRPSVSGGTRSQPTANRSLLEVKAKEYREMPDGPAKDDLANWLIDNDGIDFLRQEAVNLASQLGTTNPNAVV